VKLPPIHTVRLDNGFRALLVKRRNLPVVASMLWYQVGSRDEGTGETGLSHFLEHMMFKGTQRYAKGDIDRVTSKLGGSNNAFTDNDVTTYYFSLASDRWEAALEIEADRMRGCLLDEAEFAAEKKVVLEELAMGEDDPWRSLHQEVESLAYRVHPYRHPIIGWREDLERVDVGAMRAYYERHYGPNRAFLVVVGDIDIARTEQRIAELFAAVPAAQPRATPLAEPPPRGERRAVQRFPGNLTRLAIAMPTCRMGEPDDFVFDVIAYVLSAGKSSRLQRRLVLEEELATDVSVYNEVRQDPGLFWIAVELIDGADPHAVERIVREELDRLASGGATAAELRRARTQLRAGYLFDEETVLDLAMKIGRFEAMTERGHRLLESVLDSYAAVTSQQIKEVAQRTFPADRCTVVWSIPPQTPAKRRRR
jgi:zinc protease